MQYIYVEVDFESNCQRNSSHFFHALKSVKRMEKCMRNIPYLKHSTTSSSHALKKKQDIELQAVIKISTFFRYKCHVEESEHQKNFCYSFFPIKNSVRHFFARSTYFLSSSELQLSKLGSQVALLLWVRGRMGDPWIFHLLVPSPPPRVSLTLTVPKYGVLLSIVF